MDGWINGRKDGPQPVDLLSAVPLAVSSGFRVSDQVKTPVTHPTSL